MVPPDYKLWLILCGPPIHCAGFHQRQESCMGLIYITRLLATRGKMDEELDDPIKKAGPLKNTIMLGGNCG